jgi:hypothetical protein
MTLNNLNQTDNQIWKTVKTNNIDIWLLLVFYIGNILVDKNTLYNGYFLTGLSVLFRIFK